MDPVSVDSSRHHMLMILHGFLKVRCMLCSVLLMVRYSRQDAVKDSIFGTRLGLADMEETTAVNNGLFLLP